MFQLTRRVRVWTCAALAVAGACLGSFSPTWAADERKPERDPSALPQPLPPNITAPNKPNIDPEPRDANRDPRDAKPNPADTKPIPADTKPNPTDTKPNPADTRTPRQPAETRDGRDNRDAGDHRDGRDARDNRDGSQYNRDGYRGASDQWRDRLRDERGDYRWQNFRGADIGLWFGRNTDNGLVIADVGTTGAIAKLGFHEGDRIVSVNGQRVIREDEFIRFLFAPENRDRRVTVVVFRDGREETIVVEPRLFMEEFSSYQSDPLERVGLIMDDRHGDRIVVVRVVPYSPAYYAGIRAGDKITSFRGQRLKNLAEFVRGFDHLDAGNIALEVNRGDKPRNLELEIQAPAERRTALKPNIDESLTPSLDRREERREERRDDRRDLRGPLEPQTMPDVDIRTPAPKGEYDNTTYPPRRYYFRPWRR